MNQLPAVGAQILLGDLASRSGNLSSHRAELPLLVKRAFVGARIPGENLGMVLWVGVGLITQET